MHKVNYFVLLQFIVINVGFGQNTKGFKLLSEKDSTGIEFAHIFFDDKLVTYSDESGNFKIDLNSSFHILSIKHLSYQTKEITKNDLNNFNIILMQEKETLLDEVVISTRKNPKNHLLLPEKSAKELFMKGLDVRFPYELKSAVYVPYEFKKGAYTIQNIVFQSRKGDDDPNSK